MELGSEISEFFSSVATEGRAKMFGRKSLSLFAFLSSSSIGTASIWILVICMVLNEITGYYDGGDGGHSDGGVDGQRCVVVIIVAMMMMVVMMVVGGDLMKMVVVVTMVMMGYGSDDGDDDDDGVW
jgi:hypothetical protein